MATSVTEGGPQPGTPELAEAGPPDVPPRPSTQSIAKLVKRRRLVRLWWEAGRNPKRAPKNLVGLALSGGGIRSATFSLGVIEALAKSSRDALSRIDILSTVSGGGYIGCFLRSLFVPNEGRGIVPDVGLDPANDVALNAGAVADQYRFARRALRSGASEQEIKWGPKKKEVPRRNPIWWLREHSRYLAPNGPTDFGYAVAYIARNWTAMVYIFMIASLAIFSILVLGEAWAASRHWLDESWSWLPVYRDSMHQLPCGKCVGGTQRLLPISPLILLATVPVIMSLVLSVAYWITERMSPSEPRLYWQRLNLIFVALGTAAGAVIVLWLAQRLGALKLSPIAIPTGQFARAILAAVLLMLVSPVVALLGAAALVPRGVALTSELRRHLTKNLATSNWVFLVIVAVALIDSLGAGFAFWLRNLSRVNGSALGAFLLPAFAYLIKKLPDWIGGPNKGSVFSLLQRFAGTVALVAGLILYGAVAVTADALMHLVAWSGAAWRTDVQWEQLSLATLIIVVLGYLSGTAGGFINLSSLHFLYASRLTRAYLGASNNFRLEAAASYSSGGSIKENQGYDYIQPELYSRADLPAPIHIINTTINETIDPQSQLVARDRKGDVLSLEPSGVRIGRDKPVPWTDVGTLSCAEQLSLGQWCAISGAAASSGMGRMTSLGFALAFTFSNVRLGYWWWSPGVRKEGRPDTPVRRVFSRVLGTFIYLYNEMTAHYSLRYVRKYLTDGGHFENSGAYRLIEARVPLILVCDNGADANYRFEDLENLVRTVRIDFGYEIELIPNDELTAFFESLGATDPSAFVDPKQWPDWRSAFTSNESAAFALALRVRTGGTDLKMIWVKPRVASNLPADLLGYAADNPTFPQQSTGDQFFDEAQWESYRKLGELSMERLLEKCPKLLAACDFDLR